MTFIDKVDIKLVNLTKKYGNETLESIDEYELLCELMNDYEDTPHYDETEAKRDRLEIVKVYNTIVNKLRNG